MLQESTRVARILGCNDVAFLERSKRTKRNILEVPYRSRDQVERSRP